jgi:transcriptional regulator with XRE-family HTH domain
MQFIAVVYRADSAANASPDAEGNMARLRFGPSIKKSRVRLGISQTDLGEKLNPKVGQGTISHWEKEVSYPSGEQKAQIRQILGQISNDSDAAATSETEDTIVSPSAIGAWLNKHRLELTLSVPELAAKSGLSSAAIYNIESGQSQNPQRTTVDKGALYGTTEWIWLLLRVYGLPAEPAP